MFVNVIYFNLVDFVCVLCDWCGELYDFFEFVDLVILFVVEKLVGGVFLLVFEWLGFWNGVMDGWYMFFVEVLSGIFVLVKIVFDLF